jgi:hypothetical protein
MNNRFIKTIWLLVSFLPFIVVFTSCQQSGTPDENTNIQDNQRILNTLAAVQTENSSLKTEIMQISQPSPLEKKPTSTQEKTATATLNPSPSNTAFAQSTLIIPGNSITATHPKAGDYIFIIDPEIWTIQDQSNDSFQFLENKNIEECSISITNPEVINNPNKIYKSNDYRLQWIIEDYENYSRFKRPDISLDLIGNNIEDCGSVQKSIIQKILKRDEYLGGPTITPIPTITERPPLSGFTCPDTLTTRLRLGDYATISTDFLWLRKEPNPDNISAEIRLYPQYAPVTIRIIGGPKCISPFIYWEVEIIESGEEAEIYTGWMAESDGENYFLEFWNPGL